MKSILHHYHFRWFFRSFTYLFDFFGLLFPVIIIIWLLIEDISNQEPVSFIDVTISLAVALVIWVFACPIILLAGN